MEHLHITAFPSGPFDTNCYLVVCTHTKQAAIIDPAPNVAATITQAIAAQGVIPKDIIITHSHWDHIADCEALSKHFSLPVSIHKDDAFNLVQPGSDDLPCWIAIAGKKPDVLLHDGDTIAIGETIWKVIHTPGHSPGSICLYCEKEKVLLSGDTLFKGTFGNISFPTSSPEHMWASLKKLATLPPETQVLPGHGSPTTIGQEPWMCNAKEMFS